MLYCTLVRSQVEYGSVVWSPYTARNVDKLERMQRRGTKFIPWKKEFYLWRAPKCLNLLSLEKRRHLFDVTFLYKALNGHLNVDVSPFLNFYSHDDPYWFRHVDDYSLKTNFARTTNFKYTYFNRIVEMWNSIPLDIRLSPSLAVFRGTQRQFSENVCSDSLRKHPFLLALRRWGRFARRNVCDSAKEIPYWWRKSLFT